MVWRGYPYKDMFVAEVVSVTIRMILGLPLESASAAGRNRAVVHEDVAAPAERRASIFRSSRLLMEGDIFTSTQVPYNHIQHANYG